MALAFKALLKTHKIIKCCWLYANIYQYQ